MSIHDFKNTASIKDDFFDEQKMTLVTSPISFEGIYSFNSSNGVSVDSIYINGDYKGIGAGVNLIKDNFKQLPEINDLVLDYDLNAVKNSIRNIFNTTPGEKILNPEFGLNLKQFLFEPMSDLVAMDIAGLIRSKLTFFEPRISVNYVNVYPMYDTSEYNIEISFSLPQLNTPSFTMAGALNSIGYTNY